MRYSRIKKNQSKKRYASLLLVILLGLIILYIAFAGTLGKFVSNWISPLFRGENETEVPGNNLDDPILTLPEGTPNSVSDLEKINDSLKLNALTMYTVQIGAFSDENNAKSCANELKTMGGAGYILHDDFYRVMAVGFQSEGDSKKVKSQLETSGVESHIYKLATAGADMNITATKENVAAIRSAYEIWEEQYLSLEQLIIDLDSGVISSVDAYNRVKEIKTDMEGKLGRLREMNANQNNNNILDGLVILYENACQSFDKILSQNSSEKVAISAEIKYTYIELIMQYKTYMEQIT